MKLRNKHRTVKEPNHAPWQDPLERNAGGTAVGVAELEKHIARTARVGHGGPHGLKTLLRGLKFWEYHEER